ncbi:diacylglycerol/lipid kinase family protein [Streptomyces jumonjinensis]|uniref:diacylglycerol/lipid kinase family protein n=1 Tax=Streptomyces jumonjinensis TaxID=1945 RepID=UPI0037A3CC4C
MISDASTPSPRRILVITNPASGSYSPRLIEEIAEACAGDGREVTVHRTTAPGDATTAVRRAVRGPFTGPGAAGPPDLVLAVGGDGTAREAVQGLSASGEGPVEPGAGSTPLLVLPGGTGNSGYRMIWGDRPWRAALDAVLSPDGYAAPRRLDLALFEETGRLVFLGACTGVIAQALVTARTTPGQGRPRYARAFADTAAVFEPYPGRVTVDGQVVHEGPTVLANVGGGRYRGGQYLLLPYSEPDDGLLDVCAIGGDVAPAEVPDLTLGSNRALDLPGCGYGRGRRITLERTDGRPLVIEHDGEYQEYEASSATLSVLPGALTLWGPTALARRRPGAAMASAAESSDAA